MKLYRGSKGRGVRRSLLTAVIGAMVATSVAACGSGSGGGADGGVPDTFRYAYSYDLPTFDPVNMTNPHQSVFLFPIYDRLVHLAPDTTPIPGLAESWELSDDALTLTMHLHTGVKFSDGETFDASVAKANLERSRGTETSSLIPLLKAIDTIEAPDPETLVINLSEPDATLLHTLSERAGMMISPAALDSGTLDTVPVGAGAYTLVEHQANDRVTYERRDDYWDTESDGVQHLEIRIMSDATARVNALTSNEVDAAGVSLTQATQLSENDAFVVDTNPTTLYYSIMFSDEIFKDVDVRTAVSLAIDRDAVVNAVLEGYGEPLGQPWATGTPAHNPDIKPEYDPEKAKEHLAAAGYPDGFEFEAIVPLVDPAPKLGEALQQMFAEVGIDMSITQLDAAQIVDNFFVQGQGGALIASTGGPPSQMLMAKQTWLPEAFYAPLHLNEPKVVEYYNKANAETDPAKQSEYMQEMTQAIHDSWLTIPIATAISPIAVSTRVEHFERYASGVQEFADITVTTD